MYVNVALIFHIYDHEWVLIVRSSRTIAEQTTLRRNLMTTENLQQL